MAHADQRERTLDATLPERRMDIHLGHREIADPRLPHAGAGCSSPETGRLPGRTALSTAGLHQRYAEYYSRAGDLLDVPLEGYEQAGDATRELAGSTASRAWPPRSLYNILGSWIRSQGISDVSNYGARVADVEGVRQVALAAVTLRAANVQTGDVADALRASELRNPYDGRPFEWSATDAAIRFRGLAQGERGTHLLYY